MKDLGISEAEWKADLDKIRQRPIDYWPPEIDEVILYARGQEDVVSYQKLSAFLRKKFNFSKCGTAIRCRYLKLIDQASD